MNYRGSRHLCMKIKDMIVDSCDNFDSIYIANIAKAYYMIEILDDNDIFYHKLERISKI